MIIYHIYVCKYKLLPEIRCIGWDQCRSYHHIEYTCLDKCSFYYSTLPYKMRAILKLQLNLGGGMV